MMLFGITPEQREAVDRMCRTICPIALQVYYPPGYPEGALRVTRPNKRYTAVEDEPSDEERVAVLTLLGR
jgi:hypothetical protein